MKLYSLDMMVRAALLKKQYPIHYYLDALLAGVDILSTLTIDDLMVVNVKKLPVNDYGAVDIPSDYVDWCYITVGDGQKTKPLVSTQSLASLNNYDSDLNIIPYNNNDEDNGELVFYGGIMGASVNTVNYNSFGESTGRLFGVNMGNVADGFKVVKERNQIQLDDGQNVSSIILGYISDGRDIDAATQVDVNAYDTIQSYIMWQFIENSRTYGLGEKQRMEQRHIDQRKILRARLSDLDVNVLKRIVQKNSRGSLR